MLRCRITTTKKDTPESIAEKLMAAAEQIKNGEGPDIRKGNQLYTD